MTIRVIFDKVILRVRKSGKCSKCTHRTRRIYTLWQTQSPFNRNAGGLPKTRSEIELELAAEAKQVRESPLLCSVCEQSCR